jgi:hypothetical protein
MAEQTDKTEEVKAESNTMLAEINQRIVETFEIFDHESNKTVDKRYHG